MSTPYEQAVANGSTSLAEWLATPDEVQGLSLANWIEARKMSEAVLRAALPHLLAPIEALADEWERSTTRARPAFLVAADELRAALASIERQS